MSLDLVGWHHEPRSGRMVKSASIWSDGQSFDLAGWLNEPRSGRMGKWDPRAQQGPNEFPSSRPAQPAQPARAARQRSQPSQQASQPAQPTSQRAQPEYIGNTSGNWIVFVLFFAFVFVFLVRLFGCIVGPKWYKIGRGIFPNTPNTLSGYFCAKSICFQQTLKTHKMFTF